MCCSLRVGSLRQKTWLATADGHRRYLQVTVYCATDRKNGFASTVAIAGAENVGSNNQSRCNCISRTIPVEKLTGGSRRSTTTACARLMDDRIAGRQRDLTLLVRHRLAAPAGSTAALAQESRGNQPQVCHSQDVPSPTEEPGALWSRTALVKRKSLMSRCRVAVQPALVGTCPSVAAWQCRSKMMGFSWTGGRSDLPRGR